MPGCFSCRLHVLTRFCWRRCFGSCGPTDLPLRPLENRALWTPLSNNPQGSVEMWCVFGLACLGPHFCFVNSVLPTTPGSTY